MHILIFILVIVALIVVHELGHFVVAKLSGMRVDEFGLGYPPRALTIAKIGETEYTLNWLPFGGFVKIYGEDSSTSLDEVRGRELGVGGPDPRAFGARPRILQVLVLVAGVAMNLLFAYVLITGALFAGTPRALAPAEIPHATHTALAISGVLPGSPAAAAGLAPGDVIVLATDGSSAWNPATPAGAPTQKSFTAFIAERGGRPVALTVRHNEQEEVRSVTPSLGVITNDPGRYALGVEVTTIGIVPLSLPQAALEGARLTWGATVLTAAGLWHFFYGIFTFHADLSQVSGPVGIAGVVGGASAAGLGNLLAIMAIISINLALINLIPIPALDGGRLLFVLIEGVIRRPINASVARAMNGASFALLVLLMVVVTVHDIYRIAG